MPQAALRYCSATPRCPNKVAHGRCQDHARSVLPAPSDAREKTGRWKRFSAAWLRQHPLCGERADGQRYGENSVCARERRTVAASVTHHRGGHRNVDECYDESRLESLCITCHNTTTARFDGGFGR